MRAGWLGHVLLAALLLRALVPHGYMPDLSASADGVIKFVICSAAGAKVVTLNPDGTTSEDKGTPGHMGEPCAFAASSHLPLPEIASVEIAPPEFVALAGPALAHDILPPARAGPPLGSRGPPLLS